MNYFDLTEVWDQEISTLVSARQESQNYLSCSASICTVPQSQIQGHLPSFGCIQLWFWPYSWIRQRANSLSLPVAETQQPGCPIINHWAATLHSQKTQGPAF